MPLNLFWGGGGGGGGVVCAVQPTSPPPRPTTAITQMTLSSYTAQSAVYTYFNAGLLQWLVNSTDIPLGLNTTTA
jgi:hypothetical protein